MSVANSYARALYEVAREGGESSADLMDRLEHQLDLLENMISASKELRVALTGPITTSKEKVQLLEELTKKLSLSPGLNQFLALLARKGRLSLLTEIREAFHAERLSFEGGVPGRLVAAEPMAEADIGTLVKAFSHKLGKKVTFRVSTDPSLLAGMKVTVNGVTYDGTLRSQLQKLRDCFVSGTPGTHA